MRHIQDIPTKNKISHIYITTNFCHVSRTGRKPKTYRMSVNDMRRLNHLINTGYVYDASILENHNTITIYNTKTEYITQNGEY